MADLLHRLEKHYGFFMEQARIVLARDILDAINEIVNLRRALAKATAPVDESEEQVFSGNPEKEQPKRARGTP